MLYNVTYNSSQSTFTGNHADHRNLLLNPMRISVKLKVVVTKDVELKQRVT